jgi:hypothetical protein
MNTVELHSLNNLSNVIDSISTNVEWSLGADGNEGSIDSTSFIVLEEIFNILNQRLEISSIKFIKNVTDKAAYEWHCDNNNPTEMNITKTALLYLPNCNGSSIELENQIYNVKPYDLFIFGGAVNHRALGSYHGPLLKYTLI